MISADAQTNRQTNRCGKRKAILGPTVCALCAFRLVKSDVRAAKALETKEQTAKRRKADREHVKETRALETKKLSTVSLC